MIKKKKKRSSANIFPLAAYLKVKDPYMAHKLRLDHSYSIYYFGLHSVNSVQVFFFSLYFEERENDQSFLTM